MKAVIIQKNRILMLLIMVLTVLFASNAYADCGTDITIDLLSGSYQPLGESFTVQISDNTLLCAMGNSCWDGFVNISLNISQGLINISENLSRTLSSNQNSYQWNLNSTQIGEKQINITFNYTEPVNCNMSTNVTIYNSSEPFIEITFPTIPTNFTIGQNYSFNITLNNTGLSNATNITGNITSGIGINFSNSTIDESILEANNSVNLTYNFQAIGGGDYSLSLFQLDYFNINNIQQTPASGTSNIFHINYNPVFEANYSNFDTTYTMNMCTPIFSFLEDNSSMSLSDDFYVYDADTYDNDSTMNFTFNTNDSNIVFSFNNVTRDLGLCPTFNWTGAANLTFTVNDSFNMTDYVNFILYVENGSTEECNGLDDDGDTLIDEGIANQTLLCPSNLCCANPVRVCEGGAWVDYWNYYSCPGGSSGPGPDPNTPPTAVITYPNEWQLVLINLGLQFEEDSVDDGTIELWEWEFGDGVNSTEQEPEYTYAEAGIYTVSLTVTDDDQATDTDTVNIEAVQCIEAFHCIEPLCCENECREALCTSDEDCLLPLPAVNEECLNPGTCAAHCIYENCTITCNSNEDCDDNDPVTIDVCENPGMCESFCENTPIGLEINIISPEPITYDTRDVDVEVETSIPAECLYQLNGGNIETMFQMSFTITADLGDNELIIYCDEQEESVNFEVEIEEEQIIENIAGNGHEHEPLMEGLLNSSGDSIFGIFGRSGKAYKASDEQIFFVLNEVIVLEGLTLKKRLYHIDNTTSEIALFITNEKPVKVLNITIQETIPKHIYPNASDINSTFNFTIIKEDPIIEFKLEHLVPGETKKVTYTLDKRITADQLRQTITNITGVIIDKEGMDELLRRQKETEENMIITKKVIREKNKTRIITSLKPKRVMKDVDVYLNIPKCMAEALNQMKFKNENFKIISDDPLIMWHFKEINDEIDLEYMLEGLVDEDCENQATIIAVAKIIEDQLIDDNENRFYEIIIPLLLIPVIAGSIIFFHRFSPGENDIEKKQRHSVEIHHHIRHLHKKGHNKKTIAHHLISSGYEKETIFHALGNEKTRDHILHEKHVNEIQNHIHRMHAAGHNHQKIAHSLMKKGYHKDTIKKAIAVL